MNSTLTHFNAHGEAHMVDVSQKAATERTAIATGRILMKPATLEQIRAGQSFKGDVLAVARIAAIQATKRTSELIPLCHPIALTHVNVNFELSPVGTPGPAYVACEVTTRTTGGTGVEMEAIVGVQIALATIYDMCKAIEKSMQITDVALLRKEGGKSGLFINQEAWQVAS